MSMSSGKRMILWGLLIMVLLLSSCGDDKVTYLPESEPESSSSAGSGDENVPENSSDSGDSIGHTTEFVFPAQAEITFHPVEMTKLEKRAAGDGWSFVRSLPFGEVDGEPVILEVYKNRDAEALCGAGYESNVLLRYRKETYGYPDCFSDSLAVNEQPEANAGLFVLEYRNPSENPSLTVQGAAELAANGPGRMGYFAYDGASGDWFGFEDWGYPRIADLDEDGSTEMINQFTGLHLSWPDVNIYRWNQGVLERGLSVKESLRLPIVSASSAEIRDQGELAVNAVTGNDMEETTSAHYRYADGKWILIADDTSPKVNHVSVSSPDGKYRIETYGVNDRITAGGLFPPEEIRLMDVSTDEKSWSMPGYYDQSFLWSPNSRYVAINIETRILGETMVLDTADLIEIRLPNLEALREKLKEPTTVHPVRPDPYFRVAEWLNDTQILVSYSWTGLEDAEYEGAFRYDVVSGDMLVLEK